QSRTSCPTMRRLPGGGARSAQTAARRPPRKPFVFRSRRDASPASLDILDLPLDAIETGCELLQLAAEPLRELAYVLLQLRRAGRQLLAGGRDLPYAIRVLDRHFLIEPAELGRLQHELTRRGQILGDRAHFGRRLVRVLLGRGHRLGELALHET